MLEDLTAMLGGSGADDLRGAAALRLRTRMQPAAGAGARLMPPTYSGADGAVYLREKRQVAGELVDCVLLDGQASQSNRFEEGLVEMAASGRVRIPDIRVDQAEFGVHSALEMSHRCFDAWVEDALDGDGRFGDSELYGRLASVINRGVARAMVEHFPVGLLLGCWASRRSNPQGSTRLARALTSEIIGYDVQAGERASSRLDLQHVSREVKVSDRGVGPDGGFETLDAKASKGKKPSELGYGNVVPQAAAHGGVTVAYAEQQTVVSLTAMRATRMDEFSVGSEPDPARDLVARELLTLLAVALLEAQSERGWDLRSGCQLVPEAEPTIEVVGRLGSVVASAPAFGLGAIDALAERTAVAAGEGVEWDVAPVELVASASQLDLLRRSLGRPVDETGD